MKSLFKFTVIFLISSFACACTPADRYVAVGGYAQGGTYTVKFNSRGVRLSPDKVRSRIDTILHDIDFTLSGYNKASLLSRLNAGETITPNGMLCGMYDISYKFFKDSGGALDVAAGPLFDAWGFGFTTDSLPSAERVEALKESSGMARLVPRMEDAIRPDGTLRSCDLLLDGAGAAPVLNFNAIAQGYSCDCVADFLHSLGVKDMLVDIGEIYCEGLNPQGKPWSVGIDSPVDGNNTPGADMQGVWHSCGSTGQGLVTSGNYRKFYVRDSRKYSHTVDPRTGFPVSHNLLSATVAAPDATTADAVATWCMVVGLGDAAVLLRDLGLEGCLIYDKDGEMTVWTSSGFGLSPLN